MKINEVHELINYYRGMYKVLEQDWQKSAQDQGITSAEQHILWILHFEKEATMSRIAQLGLWEISTVMQVIKRLTKKGLVDVQKNKKDLRISYVTLTDEGKKVREETQNYTYKITEYLHDFAGRNEENRKLIDQMKEFLLDFNKHFHGEEFSKWVKHTSKSSD
ncbi:MarR family protease production transcriptional regulator HPr [Salirhabdus euzebyi]|uniref:MarR family protease production transcriptional regulator HPr n=1 Tax=Salirhabdus euzebyi TaxID=394506 RepID=A0A841PVZ5_9BACI|nr:MarR family transcriptional regulator [Salirhabdus euzebyi]MBB6451944.1 MarR family protease production transcriptional regulator HPr [Salirhabdus euzebyi]